MEKNNLDDKLFDAMLKVAAEEALKQEMDEMPSCEEMNTQYRPSPDLEKKIRKQISQHRLNEKVSLWKKSAVKVAVSAAVFIVISSTILLSVEATRNYIFNAAIKWHEDYFSIQHSNNKSNVADLKNYRLTYVPLGFKETSTVAIGDILKITYENDDGMRIVFKQSPSETSHILADYEGKKYSTIKVNGQEAYLFNATEDDKTNTLLWEFNGSMLTISSEVGTDELILMAENIKK